MVGSLPISHFSELKQISKGSDALQGRPSPSGRNVAWREENTGVPFPAVRAVKSLPTHCETLPYPTLCARLLTSKIQKRQVLSAPLPFPTEHTWLLFPTGRREHRFTTSMPTSLQTSTSQSGCRTPQMLNSKTPMQDSFPGVSASSHET